AAGGGGGAARPGRRRIADSERVGAPAGAARRARRCLSGRLQNASPAGETAHLNMTVCMHHPSITRIVRRVPWSADASRSPEPLLAREWIVTNGLGGYASGTIAGVATRRYHGLLIAALPAPLGRCVMLGQVTEMVRLRSDE